MIAKLKRFVPVLCLVAALFMAAFLPTSGDCENLRFVFMADSQGGASLPINTPVLNAIISQIQTLSPPPAFVVFAGDMVSTGYNGSEYTFQTWKNLFAPLTSAGIALYTAIGNHELFGYPTTGGFLLENQHQFQIAFSENPGNGPPGYERLVYSFTSPGGDAFFATLDPYYLTADNPNPDVSGNIDDIQLDWLADQLTKTTASHKFLFMHTPYYYVTNNPSEPSIPNVSLTKLWSILDQNRFDLYACGHSHLYSRKTIDSSITPNPQTDPPRPPWQNNVVQLLSGTCGAPVDTDPLIVDPTLWHVFNAPDTYYFSVVDIDGSRVTVNSYSGNTGAYALFDSFDLFRMIYLPLILKR